MILGVVYTVIVAVLLALVVSALLREDRLSAQLTCMLVLIPLVLRLLGVK